METKTRKSLLLFKSLFIALLAVGCFTSCSDDEEGDGGIRPVAAPTNLVCTEATETSLTFTWEAVEGVTQYGYTLQTEEGENVNTGVVNEPTVTISGLSEGTTYTLEVTAYGDGVGTSNSDPVTVTATTLVNEVVGYQRTGELTTANGTDTRVLEIDEEGNYIIRAWYGVDGYDLIFKIVDGKFVITNGYYYDASVYGYEYNWLPTTSDDEGVWLMPGYANVQVTAGYIYFYIWDSNNQMYIEFTSKTTVDDLVGEYTDVTYQWYDNDWASWGEEKATITKVDETNIIINGLAQNYTDWTAEVEFDENGYATGNIIIKGGQSMWTWYTVGDYNSDSANVVATFDGDFNITLSNYAGWYGGYIYYYLYTELTKK